MGTSNKNIKCKLWTYVKEHNQSSPDKVAIVDGAARYTYGEMFDQWDRYAAAFTGLGMTGKNHARVGVLGSTSAEATFAIYGLNMVGAEVSLLGTFFAFNTPRIISTIRSEKLTDIILTDDFAQPALFDELLKRVRGNPVVDAANHLKPRERKYLNLFCKHPELYLKLYSLKYRLSGKGRT